MTRPLLITVACGYIVALVCFVTAFAIAGPAWAPWNWHGDWSDGPWTWHDRRGPAVEASGPTVSRELTWDGGESLRITIPAEITYTQGPVAKIVVTGPKGAVDHVRMDDETLRFDRRVRRAGRLQVVMTAPDVREFTLAGSQRLTVEGFDHERLEIQILGSGDATARGKAGRVEVEIAGSGDVDLGAVETAAAEVSIAGSGDATVAPKDRVEVHIAGSGDVVLKSRPAQVETHIAGSGRIVQEAPVETPAAPSATPKTTT